MLGIVIAASYFYIFPFFCLSYSWYLVHNLQITDIDIM